MSVQFRDYGYTGKPGTCKWCGRKLRRKYNTEKANTDQYVPVVKACVHCGCTRFDRGPHGFSCGNCETYVAGRYVRRTVSRTPVYDKPGDYGDGHFCGLRCGYDFAVCKADQGSLFKPVTSEET